MFGLVTLLTWPWLIAGLFTLTRRLRPVFSNHPVVEVVMYAGAGILIVRYSLDESSDKARDSSTDTIWQLLQWFGASKWFAEIMSRALVMLISGASRGIGLFLGVNLFVNAIPDGWSMNLPSDAPSFLQLMASPNRVLRAGDLELLVFKWSQKALFAYFSSLLGCCLLQLKQAPRTPVPEEEGLRYRKRQDRWRFPSLAALMFAKQHPQDRRIRYLAQRLALPDRLLDFFAVFGLVVLPWTYLFGFRIQTDVVSVAVADLRRLRHGPPSRLQRVLAIGGVGGLAVGLAAQNLVGNLISGVLIQLNRPFSEGDEIEADKEDELRGIVDDVGFTVTRINRLDGVRVHVPNSRLLGGVIVNWAIKNFRRVQDTIPVIAADLTGLPDLVRRVQALLDEHPGILQASDISALKKRHGGKLKLYPPVCAFVGHGPLGANLFIRAYMRGSMSNQDFLMAKSELLLRVNQCVLESGLSIGFGCFTQVPQFPGVQARPPAQMLPPGGGESGFDELGG